MSDITRDTVWLALQDHVGEDAGIGAAALTDKCALMVQRIPGMDAERHIRKLIEELRRDGKPICGIPQAGYFIAADTQELNRACMFLFSRAMTGLEQIAAMKGRKLPDLRAELGLS